MSMHWFAQEHVKRELTCGIPPCDCNENCNHGCILCIWAQTPAAEGLSLL